MEGTIAQLQRFMASGKFGSFDELNAQMNEVLNTEGGLIAAAPPVSPADRAQEMIYEAWDCDEPECSELARRALALNPDCADAYLILTDAASSQQEALALIESAVEAGERSLPKGCLQDPEWVGHFWSIFETRPYMRARQILATALLAEGRRDEAISHYQEMLRLNPNDNQGLRDDLIAWLIAEDRDEAATELLDQYASDPSAVLLYERALIEFKRCGPTDKANRALARAVQANQHVPLLFLEHRLPPMPGHYGFGDMSEAIVAAYTLIAPLVKHPAAVKWLLLSAVSPAGSRRERRAANRLKR